MARRYDDVVEVRTEEGRVQSFIWDGRVYVVAAIVATWYVRHAWWRETQTPALEGLRLESRLWRVEARAGTSREVGVFDLVEGSPWRVIRAWD